MDLNTITAVARPQTREALPGWREGDAFLGGGTWLFSEPQPRLSRLIDLAALGWEPLRRTPAGLEIAATCTVAELDSLAAPVEWTAAPLIGQCCRAFLASFKVWNTATVGGNLCLALPAGPMISLAAALNGVCTIWTPDGGERRIDAASFVTAAERNVLLPGEILRRIDISTAALTRRTAFRQISLTPVGRSAALLIGTRAPKDAGFVLTVTASTPHPVRLAFATMPSAAELRARLERDITAYHDDMHGLPAWRRHMTLHFAEEIRSELSAEPSR
ncbi:MAG: FAD binding domain-containing protein [Pseudolabrys sp.]|nr:FAD binding domain-containing protein [Pseudolabrys sp.]